MPHHGIVRIVAQVARRLERMTKGFSQDGVADLSLPESQAIRNDYAGFAVRIRAHLRALKPGLARQEFELALKDGKLRFYFSPQET